MYRYKVSVIIPAYNVEKYIAKCLDSVVNQTLDSLEVIVINDGSTDSTGDLVDEYGEKYDFVKVIHQNNEGLYRTREIGISVASGEYIGWVDADDYIKKDMYEKLYGIAKKNNSELVICNYDFFPKKISTKEKWYQQYRGNIDIAFIERNSQPWNKIVKRDLLDRAGVSNHFVDCHDEIYIKVLFMANNPITLDEPLYIYRVSGGMSSSYKNVKHYKKYVDASINLKKIMHSFIDSKYWSDYFDNRISYYLLMTMIVSANAADKNSYIETKMKLKKMKPKYKKNSHYWEILKHNFGVFRAVVIGWIIPSSYTISRFICKVAFRYMR